MRREEIEALYAQGIDALVAVIGALEGRIEELERRASQDSGQ